MRAEIRRIQTELGVTTIFVTHDQTEAMTMGDRVAVMKKGLLQQVDTPEVLYERPANLFVGGFIGSPAMNLVGATLVRTDGRLVARFGSTELAVDERFVDAHPEIMASAGQRVVLGIRPETIEHERFTGLDPAGRRLRATVDLRESLGAEALVHFKMDAPPVLTEDTVELVKDREDVEGADATIDEDGLPFVAKIDSRADARLGETIPLVVDTSRLHVFDPKDGRAIA
jgi:multiple sugar transport system ATP-binding protein